jgi:pyruvate/2-oxoglutarate dehydrogenase complex dihydrolipoamide dehydrogenase (E3) component
MESSDTGRPLFYPLDEHNERLLANVHPSPWTNPEPQPRYHLVVIGAGTAGLVSAAGAAGLGAKVALIERHMMGGDCLNVGCVPSKGVIAAARVWHTVFEGHRYGAPPHIGSGDFGKAMERMRRIRADISPHDSVQRFTDLGIDVFLGEGKFVGNGAIEVDGKRLNFRRAIIATGARAAHLPIPGLDRVDYLTNESVFSLTTLPKRLGILGGGPIGCELAQAFARFGSQVTLFEAQSQVLPREDPDAAAVIQAALARDGIRLEIGVKIEEISRSGREKVLRLEQDGVTREVAVDELLVSVGRAPNVESLALESAGVEYGKQGVKVDDKMCTTNSKVFACGDVASPLQFTHAADAQARLVLRNAFFFGRSKSSDLVVPWCTYTSPEVAHVGLYAKEAEQRGIDVDTLRIDMKDVDRALLDGATEGFLKIHLRRGSDEILGATIVADHAGDLLAELCLALTQKIGLGKIAETIHPYPTTAEILKKAADSYNRTRLTPIARRFFGLWFKIFR